MATDLQWLTSACVYRPTCIAFAGRPSHTAVLCAGSTLSHSDVERPSNDLTTDGDGVDDIDRMAMLAGCLAGCRDETIVATGA